MFVIIKLPTVIRKLYHYNKFSNEGIHFLVMTKKYLVKTRCFLVMTRNVGSFFTKGGSSEVL